MASTPINVADVIAEYGAYYLGQNNQSRLFSETYRNIREVERGILTLRRIEATRWESADSNIDPILQPFQKDFTPNSQVNFIPHFIDLFKQKAEIQVCPDELSESWLMFLEGDSIDRAQWPFIRWLIEVHFLPRLRDDMNESTIYKGAFVAPTAGTAGAPETAMDGIEAVQNQFVTDGLTTPIALGAIPTSDSDLVTYVEDFIDAIDDRYRSRIPSVQMSEELAVRYSRGYQEKYGTNVMMPGSMQNSRIAHYNATVEGMTSMQGKNRIWATVPGNALLVAKKWNNVNQVQVSEATNPREVNIFTDFYAAVNFALPRLVFLSDQT